MSTIASPKSLTSAAVRGVQWTTAASVATALMQIGYTAIMARLLDPAAFGLVAMAGVVLRFGTYFAEMGIGHAIVQRSTISQDDVRASFTASLGLGAVVTVLACLLAPLATFFLNNEAVVSLVRFQSLGFVFVGLGMTATSLLRREMRFEVLAKIEVAAYILGYGGVGVTLAWATSKGLLHIGGVWSLIAGTLAQQLLVAIMSYLVVRHSMKLIFKWNAYKQLLGYGSRVSIISFLEFINGNLDTMLIGRLLGPVLLGIYNRAYMLLYLPMYFLTNSLARVAFPAFSKVKDDVARVRSLYLTSSTLVATVVMPLCAGVAVAAPELVEMLLGPRWAASVPILRVLCISIPLSMTTLFAGVVADARANLRQKIILNIEFMLLLASLFGLLRSFGLAGIAAAIGTGEVVRTFLYMRITHNDIGIPYRRLFAIYVPGLINAAAVGTGLLVVSLLIRPLHLPTLVTLLVQMLTGAIVLGAVVLRWPSPELRSPLQQLLSRLQQLSVIPAAGRALLLRYEMFLERRKALLFSFDPLSSSMPS
ncbi:lipopolysaccharide biosynthesis protein [Hymenobacter sp. GOD-10R]|uniref:lipopolysaccharide biosynthesis protein n=1 Tax=Hymenobacter sp. GOD-10R TaxID=3093922 RepID=UPI002D76CCD3|nr:lipopolysaccharide biosynthesis protein [Hymenobacter sp. GOD-10R]WRQ28801.1 lipopolysaccharide biosynthesis protein [Hymenobacter sp. GOD-10R]